MTPSPERDPSEPPAADASRRTWLAAERTWLAWWRTGVGASAVAVAVGRLLPGLTKSPRLPFRLLGLGYAALAVGVLVVGAVRQQRTAEALRRGEDARLSSSLVMWLTAAAVAVAMGTLVVVVVAL